MANNGISSSLARETAGVVFAIIIAMLTGCEGSIPIVFSFDRDGDYEIFIMDTDGATNIG